MRNTTSKPLTNSSSSRSTITDCRTLPSLQTLAHSMRPSVAMLVTLLLLAGFCANTAHGSPAQTGRNILAIRTQQCREGCFEKFATKETLCQQSAECLTCWDECAKPPPPKINKSIRETWSLHTVSMLQQDSLVLVDVAWAPLSTPNQCLVTWEVSGGGLMGNLLTESFNVQLSLWPDTKYRVQVTCKNKLNGIMSRSLPLTIDTAEAIATQDRSQPPTSKQTSTTLLPAGDKIPNASSLEELAINSVATLSAEQEDVSSEPVVDASGSAGSSLPYDDQSAETINQHTNFIFNWHKKNNDISAIEPLTKPDLNLLNIASLSQLQKPLIFGVIAGTLLLAFILLLYICMMRQQRLSSDKIALIADDINSVVVTFPPTTPIGNTATLASYGGVAEEVCQHAAICSRNALKV